LHNAANTVSVYWQTVYTTTNDQNFARRNFMTTTSPEFNHMLPTSAHDVIANAETNIRQIGPDAILTSPCRQDTDYWVRSESNIRSIPSA